MADVSGTSRLSVEINGVPPVVVMPEDRKLKGGSGSEKAAAFLIVALTVTYLVLSFTIPVGMLERTREMTGTGSLDLVVANCIPLPTELPRAPAAAGRRLSGTESVTPTGVVTGATPPLSQVVAPIPFFAGPGPREQSVIDALGKLELANILYIVNNALFGLYPVGLCILALSQAFDSDSLEGCGGATIAFAMIAGTCGGCVSIASFVLTIMLTIAVNDVDLECPSNAYEDMDGMVGMCWLVYFFPVIFACCIIPITCCALPATASAAGGAMVKHKQFQ